MEEDNGLTFTDVLKVIFKKIWWVVGSMALALIAVVLIIQLWYNPTVNSYSVSFEISFPDKTDFVSSEFTSLKVLEKIQSGEYSGENVDEFKGVEVKDMYANDDIAISKVSSDDGKIYTLTVKASYFKSDKQAASFIRKVAAYPIISENETVMNKDYRPYVKVYDEAETYAEKIEAIVSQKRYLQSEYALLIQIDKSAEVKLAALDNVFTSTQRQYLLDTINANRYVIDTEAYKKSAESQKEVIKTEKENNNYIISQLQAERDEAITKPTQGEGQNAYDTKIAEYIEKNAKLDNQVKEIDATLAAIEEYTKAGSEAMQNKQQFDELLDGYRNQLISATDVLKDESVRIYGEKSDVIYSNNKIVKSGGMGVFASAIIGAVIGLVISAAVICIIDLPKYKKSLLANASSGNASSDGVNAEESVSNSEEIIADDGDKKDTDKE